MQSVTRIASSILILALAFILAGTSALRGQDAAITSSSVVPPLIKFSGVIPSPGTQNRTSDSASAGLVTATFSLYALQEGGSPLWSETQSVQLDEQGRYAVLLGAASPNGLPLDLFSNGKALWLGVQPQLAGAGELPRVLLAAVPYALKASDSETLGGKPASAYALAGAPTMVEVAGVAALSSASATSTSTGSKVNAAAGSTSSPQPLTACTAVTSDGTATANTVAKFTTACNIENSLIRDTGTGVAVGGAAAPGALLDVQFSSTANSGALLGQRVLATLNPSLTSTASIDGLFSNVQVASSNTRNFFGNLYGLNSEFDHFGSGKVTSGFGLNGAVVNQAAGTITNAYGIYTSLSNASTGTITNGYGVYVNAPSNTGTFSKFTGLYIASPTAVVPGAYGVYSAGGKNYFGGNVGIGTTTPGANLEVNGTAKFDAAVTFAKTQTFSGNGAGLTNVNAAELGGLLPGAFQPVGAYAVTTGANSFAAMQTINAGDLSISNGNVDLPQTIGASVGVINLGGSSFIHACCTAVQGEGPNTFVGPGAGNFATTGAGNTALGARALLAIAAGYANTAIGIQAMWLNSTGSGNVAVGGSALTSNTTGSYNVAVGGSALPFNTIGTDNTGVGNNAGNTDNGTPLGSNQTFVGAGSGPFSWTDGQTNFNNATAIGACAGVSASNALVLGAPASGGRGGFCSPTITANTNVGIDVATPSNIFTVLQGGGHAIADGWDTYSSRRWKSDIQPLQGVLGKVERLRGVSYTYTANGKHDIGMIAEEVGKVVPEVVSYEENGKDARGIDYARLTALLVEAVKQQQSEIQQEKSQIRRLEAKVRRLEASKADAIRPVAKPANTAARKGGK